MSDNYLIEIILILLFHLYIISQCVRCEPLVTAKCGRPSIPPEAQISPNKIRFDDNEIIEIRCKHNGFPLIKHELECNKGRWKGKPPRCGQHMDAQVIHLNIFNCDSNEKTLLVSQPLNQTADAPPQNQALRPNSFHRLRVPNHHNISAIGYNCYTFRVKFEKSVKFWFLLVDIWVDIWVDSIDTNIGLDLTPFVNQLRTCVKYDLTKHIYKSSSVFGFNFVCDLNNESDITIEETNLLDTISFDVKTNSTEEIGLEAIFIGDIFTEKERPNCGQIQIQTVGVVFRQMNDHFYISCNDSFIQLNQTGLKNPEHKFRCSQNGVWVGNWPVCVPKKTCPLEVVMEKDSSVNIDEIANVYYLNESQWFAIDYSYVSYSCVNKNYIIFGHNVRTCLKDHKWSSKPPVCIQPSGIFSAAIAGTLFGVFVIIVLIVLFVFRMHSKRVNRELKETRNQLNEIQRRNCREYESIDYDQFNCQVNDQPRYQLELYSNPSPPEDLVLTNSPIYNRL